MYDGLQNNPEDKDPDLSYKTDASKQPQRYRSAL